MKRILIAIAAFLYLGSSAGATVHLHYCMGKLVDWGLGYNHLKVWGECGMEEENSKDNCCKDEHTFLKNDSDQKIVESSFQLVKLLASAPLISHPDLYIAQIPSFTEENPVSNAPPRSSNVAVYILKRTFLI